MHVCDRDSRRVIELFALVMIGFSLCAAALLVLAGATVYADAQPPPIARAAGIVLLVLSIVFLVRAGSTEPPPLPSPNSMRPGEPSPPAPLSE
jgi:hypothetical protein